MSAAKAKEKAGKGSEAEVAEEVKISGAPEEVEGQAPSAEDKPEETKVPIILEVPPIPPKAPTEKEVETVKTKEWIVCSGKSVTSKRGIIGAGSKVSPSDFPGGSDTMDSLKNRKIIELK